MTDKKLTDSEIIKALECCVKHNGNCEPCEIYDFCREHHEQMPEVTLDLINRLQAKNEALQMDIKQLETDNFNANMNCEHLQAEIESLKKVLKIKSRELKNKIKTCDEFVEEKVMFPRKIKTAKAEAYKEFAERLKENSISIFTSKGIVTVEGIDNLLNELVGEDNA